LTDDIVIELSDTDMARFVHFSKVVQYFEVGLRRTMETIDLTFRDLFDRGLGLPIVDVTCSYEAPMMYADRVTLTTTVEDVSESTVTLGLHFVKEDGATAAEGTMMFCFYDMGDRSATAIPDEIRADLESLAG
jgi:acyl-CoA thioester hydrolase